MQTKFIETPDEYRELSFQLIRVVAEEAQTNRENTEIADLCSHAARLGEHAEGQALDMLQHSGFLHPTYLLFSKAGDGMVVPIVISKMPDDRATQIALVTPIVTILGLAPIDGYAFISEMWGAPIRDHQQRPSDSQSRMSLILVRAFVGLDSYNACFTIVRHPETDRVMSLRPLRNPVASYGNNLCLSNLYDMVEQWYSSMSMTDIAWLKAHIVGSTPHDGEGR